MPIDGIVKVWLLLQSPDRPKSTSAASNFLNRHFTQSPPFQMAAWMHECIDAKSQVALPLSLRSQPLWRSWIRCFATRRLRFGALDSEGNLIMPCHMLVRCLLEISTLLRCGQINLVLELRTKTFGFGRQLEAGMRWNLDPQIHTEILLPPFYSEVLYKCGDTARRWFWFVRCQSQPWTLGIWRSSDISKTLGRGFHFVWSHMRHFMDRQDMQMKQVLDALSAFGCTFEVQTILNSLPYRNGPARFFLSTTTSRMTMLYKIRQCNVGYMYIFILLDSWSR